MATNPHAIATEWLAGCTTAINDADAEAFTKLFLPNGWLRDFLVFTWDVRSLADHERIQSYLASHLASAKIRDVKLDESVNLAPRASRFALLKGAECVELAFTFECKNGHGHAHCRLFRDEDSVFRALALFMEVYDLHGHEELQTLPFRDDVSGIPGRDMQQEFADYVKSIETNPYVLIVGGGQTGLLMAARLKQFGIPALVIERSSRIGDNWRQRYPSLTLHTVKTQNAMPYQPYPTNWPEFTPRDKVAEWLELYPKIQDLVVWTSTELKDRPIYNQEAGEWDVSLLRDGVEVKLKPAHILLATGSLGTPNIPNVEDRELFRGKISHSHTFPGGAAFAGQRVVVIGAGNSAIDICQDLVVRGAANVTMVQRSATCVTARARVAAMQRAEYPPGVPVEVSDFKRASRPYGLMKRLGIANQQLFWDAEKELFDKLRKGGLKLTMGPEGEGAFLLVIGRGGGYWLDKGGADLIADGKIKVRNGISPQKFTEQALIMDDGSELPADAVIFATGYQSMRDSNAALFGENVIDQTDEVYGLDEEGEIKGSYRPSGYPGLWFASGNFTIARTMSKPLALQLKAIQVGLVKHNGRRDGTVDAVCA